jgi:type VI secretion system protein
VSRLLERIASPDRREDTVGSVLDHLRAMLNTRQGSVLTCPDYGMPDLTEFMQAPDVQRALQSGILNSIRKYEPRLKRVNVTYAGAEGLTVHFDVNASLDAEDGAVALHFETVVDSWGVVQVRG